MHYYPFHFLGNKEFLRIIDFDLRVIQLSICSLLRILLLSDNRVILLSQLHGNIRSIKSWSKFTAGITFKLSWKTGINSEFWSYHAFMIDIYLAEGPGVAHGKKKFEKKFFFLFGKKIFF